MTDYIDAAINILLGRNVSKINESKQAILDKALENMAQIAQKSDESIAKASVRVLESNLGQLIYAKMSNLSPEAFTTDEVLDALKADNLAIRKNISASDARYQYAINKQPF